MKADVRPLQSAENRALKWAISFFLDHADALTADGGKASRVRIIANASPEEREKSVRRIANLALFYGDLYAIDILRELAAECIAEGKPLTGSLQTFTCLFLKHPFRKWRPTGKSVTVGEKIKSRPGPRERDLSIRNIIITVVIESIAKEWGFAPTRNTASKDTDVRASAASIVRDALERAVNINLTEAAVNKIWHKHLSVQRHLDQPVGV
jgi:hypothetical protein